MKVYIVREWREILQVCETKAVATAFLINAAEERGQESRVKLDDHGHVAVSDLLNIEEWVVRV